MVGAAQAPLLQVRLGVLFAHKLAQLQLPSTLVTSHSKDRLVVEILTPQYYQQKDLQ
jgi:hypothetical protein